MARTDRKKLIEEIEKIRGSRVVGYVTSDRAPVTGQIGDDALRPLYEQLREIGHAKKLDLFVYSRGGAIDVPWRMATAIRTASDEWAALIPFRANSAATLLAIGADEIVLGRNGELGPIDPFMNLERVLARPGQPQGTVVQEAVSVEDVMAYVRFARERAGLSDQAALASSLTKLTDRLDAVALGSLYRTHSHIRDVAKRMLTSRKEPGSQQAMATIVETLAEKVYAHGHAIGFREAKDLGLPVVSAPEPLDVLLWDLLRDYEQELKLLDPLDPSAVVAAADSYEEPATLALIETTSALHRFAGRIQVRAQRQMPQTLNVNLNLNVPLSLPPGEKLTAEQQSLLQRLVQAAQQAVLQQAQQAAQQAVKAQAPLLGFEAGFRSGKWSREP